MGKNTEEIFQKPKRSAVSTILYVSAILVALIGIAYLVTNIVLFQKTVAQYVAQGYPAATVISQLLPSQLLPGIYEPLAIYGGIALLLFGVGSINQKAGNFWRPPDKTETEGAGPETEGTGLETEGAGPKTGGAGPETEGAGPEAEAWGLETEPPAMDGEEAVGESED